MKEIDRIVQHLLRHKEFALNVLSSSYPFSITELRKYADILDWFEVSANENIYWTESLFNEFESMISVDGLRGNESFPWTEAFIDKHIKELFYVDDPMGEWKSYFGMNKTLPWSEHFIDKYIEHWDLQFLSMNDNIPFTIELIDKYKDNWRFDLLQYTLRTKADPELKSHLSKFYNCNIKDNTHSCKFCFQGAEILEEYKGRRISLEFIYCPNFKWSDDIIFKLKSRIQNRDHALLLIDTFIKKAFKHWSIEVLDAFEEYWEYDENRFPRAACDYLAFAVKENDRLQNIMNELKDHSFNE